MLRWLGLVALVVTSMACKFAPERARPSDGGDDLPEAGVVDAADGDAVDARVFDDAPLPAAGCFGSFETICLPVLPAASLTFSVTAIDTDDPGDCDTTAIGTTVDACVRAGTTVSVNGIVTAHGSRPLVLVATTGMLIVNGSGVVDVASHFGARGAGANPAGQCAPSNAAGASGGGAGGSLRGAGGPGGSGPQGSGGTPHATVEVERLRGGCQGATGGSSASSNGGDGGGAVLLIGAEIQINGIVTAAGAGGRGGSANATTLIGGGGGGSGGVVVLDTGEGGPLAINGSGRVVANGGGGGEGNTGVVAGDFGDDPDPSRPGSAANGGSGSFGGDGGAGSTTDGGLPGGSGTATSAGGGGGGGAGFIRRTSDTFTNNGQTSPGVSE